MKRLSIILAVALAYLSTVALFFPRGDGFENEITRLCWAVYFMASACYLLLIWQTLKGDDR